MSTSLVTGLSTNDHQTALQASIRRQHHDRTYLLHLLHWSSQTGAPFLNIIESQKHQYTVCCRDGLERIEVDAGGTIGTLRQQISSDLNMPRENVTLSKDQKLVCMRIDIYLVFATSLTCCTSGAQLVSKTPEQFKDLSNNKVRLKQAGVQHGDMVRAVAAQSQAKLASLLLHMTRVLADLHAVPFCTQS